MTASDASYSQYQREIDNMLDKELLLNKSIENEGLIKRIKKIFEIGYTINYYYQYRINY